MRVPKEMRKRFEEAYPHNAKVKACEWCCIYHAYKAKPVERLGHACSVSDEIATNQLLESFIASMTRKAWEYLASRSTLSYVEFSQMYNKVMADNYALEVAK